MRVVKEYCCCAIPLHNAGIYLTLLTNIVIAATVGTLALATPSIVGASTPSFASWIMAGVCYVAVAIQVLGLLGVSKESTIIYRRFTTLHCLITIGIFAVSAVFIGWSGTKHNTAQTKCESEFFSNTTTTSSGSGSPINTAGEGTLLCNIFAWVTFGVMIGLWAVLGIFELYLYLVISGYGSSQRDDHAQYSLYSVNDGAAPNDLLLADRAPHGGQPWDSRRSMDNVPTLAPGKHYRSDSDATVHEKAYNDFPQTFEQTKYETSSPYQSNNQYQNSRQYSMDDRPAQPVNAYTQEPGPTPTYNDTYYQSQGNPGESNVYPGSRPYAHPGQ